MTLGIHWSTAYSFIAHLLGFTLVKGNVLGDMGAEKDVQLSKDEYHR